MTYLTVVINNIPYKDITTLIDSLHTHLYDSTQANKTNTNKGIFNLNRLSVGSINITNINIDSMLSITKERFNTNFICNEGYL